MAPVATTAVVAAMAAVSAAKAAPEAVLVATSAALVAKTAARVVMVLLLLISLPPTTFRSQNLAKASLQVAPS